MNGIGKRLRQARKDRGLTLERLANACGWEGAGRVSNYESERRPLGVDDLLLLATALDVLPAWLMTGEGPQSTTSDMGRAHHIRADVPVVDFATLADVDLRQGPVPATMAISWIGGPVKYGPRTFAFKMPDSSMASTTDQSIPAGHFVWVDPDQRDPAHDTPALARLASGQYIVAQYMAEAGRQWLHRLNPAYPRPEGPFELVGRVIFSGRER